jgi:GAF domain-containing protein
MPEPETKATRSLERTEIKLNAVKPEDATDTAVRELARAFEVPLSLVCVLETDPEFWKSLSQRAPSAPLLEASVYADVLTSDTLLVVEDVAKDDRFSRHPMLLQRGVRFFASAPLRARGGHLVGNLCVLDTHPRAFGETESELVQSLGAQLMEVIDANPTALAPGSARG